MIEAKNKAELYEALQERYQVGRTTIINRLNKLNLEAKKAKGRAWFEEEEIKLLDQLQEWLDSKQGTTSEFIAQNIGMSAIVDNKLEKTEEISLESNPVNIHMSDGGIKQMAQLMAIAQEKAGGILIAERVLTAQYLANPDLLNDELQAKLAEYDEKCLPASINAEDFALKLIEEFN